MRNVLWVLVCLLPLRASATSCITRAWTARDFLAAKTDAARVVGQSQDTLVVTSPLFGTRAQKGGVVRVVPDQCHTVLPGVEYFIAMRCTPGAECQWDWTEAAHTTGFEEFAGKRHLVTRSEVVEALRSWQQRRRSTEELRRWLTTADASDAGGDIGDSLALAVVERIEDLLDFFDQAQACQPGDGEWLREHGASLYLQRFARLPKQQTRSAYDAWLDEHEDAEDEWDPRQLEKDLERSLEGARSWSHSIDCFLRTHRETPP